MFWKRIKNLWELSKYGVSYKGGLSTDIKGNVLFDSREPILKQVSFPKRKQVLATITSEDPLKALLDENEAGK